MSRTVACNSKRGIEMVFNGPTFDLAVSNVSLLGMDCRYTHAA